MPPKTKFTLDDIGDAALSVVRREGLDRLTSRAVAEELKSSTMPIYSCGKSMAEIEEDVVKRCWEILCEYQNRTGTPDLYVNMGLGYILFAKHESHLFGCIHSLRHTELNKRYAEENFMKNMVRLNDHPLFSGTADDIKMKILIQGWIFCHGLADFLSKNHDGLLNGLTTDEDLAAFLMEASRITTIGIVNYLGKEGK
jgi:hypothetical protein